eukprot:gene2751-4159_t
MSKKPRKNSTSKNPFFASTASVEDDFDFFKGNSTEKKVTFKTMMKEHFPGSMLLSDYISKIYNSLKKHGFKEKNTLPCVCTCRDEIAFDVTEEFKKYYKAKPFDLSSLAGMMFGGVTSLQAALSHAPMDKEEKERYIFVAMPHVAIYKDGAIGVCKRKGREELSHACGALLKFKNELDKANEEGNKLDLTLDLDDMELSLLKQRLLPKLEKDADLIDITKVCHDVIKDDFERILKKVMKEEIDYAFLTAVQIHGPNDETWIWPYQQSDFFVVENERRNLKFTDERKIEVDQ